MSIDKNTFEQIYDTFRVEKIIYLETLNEPDITDKKSLLLNVRLYGTKGLKFEIKLHENNTCSFVHHINACLEEFQRPILSLNPKLFQSFCLKQGCRNLIDFKFIFDLDDIIYIVITISITITVLILWIFFNIDIVTTILLIWMSLFSIALIICICMLIYEAHKKWIIKNSFN